MKAFVPLGLYKTNSLREQNNQARAAQNITNNIFKHNIDNSMSKLE